MFSLFSRRRPLLLLVCTANVCRSPAAAAALRAALRARGAEGRFRVQSAGTNVGAPGRKPDPRMAKLCRHLGLSLRGERATQLTAGLAGSATLIVCMEQRHVDSVMAMVAEMAPPMVRRLGEWLPAAEEDSIDIADPYYANAAAMEEVLELITDACGALAEDLTHNALLRE